MAIQTPGQSVDVQSRLMLSRRRIRPPGVVPYPVQSEGGQAAYDDWNYMFCKKVFGHPSMHPFNTPPSKVLDLGCGSGLWVLEAAQQWPSSSFVGFDLQRTQPDLSRASLAVPDAALRVRWVHGNLLEHLPFESDTFDFVRISGIGLGVPEDEWQDLFQEVSRIMQPGAVLEIMEDDLLFPCGNVHRPREIRPVISNGTSEPPTSSSPPTKSPKASPPSLPFSGSRSPTTHPVKSPHRKAKPLEKEWSGSSVGSNNSGHSSSIASDMVAYAEYDFEFELILDPRDHSKLKRAWNSMLDRRFLTSGLLAVLPFYLSAEFVDVQSKTAVNVPLPPNSVYVPDDDDTPSSPGILPSRRRSNTLQSIASVLDHSASPDPTELLAADCASNYRARSRSVTTTSWASMHLAKTVSLLQGCKEAIWEEYRQLDCDLVTHQSLNVKRAEFLTMWSNWERDMRNRMGIRSSMPRAASWTTIFPGDDPGWKEWRAHKYKWDKKEADAGDSTTSLPKEEELCRSLRGFVARKPSTTPKG